MALNYVNQDFYCVPGRRLNRWLAADLTSTGSVHQAKPVTSLMPDQLLLAVLRRPHEVAPLMTASMHLNA